MDRDTKQALVEYLSGFITEHKRRRFEEVLANRTRHLAVVLEDIYQPHNASAVIRTADCFGIQDLHVIENRNRYTLNPGVSVGASKWVSLRCYDEFDADNVRACVDSLRRRGYRIAATTPHRDDVTVAEVPVDQPLALAFGTEETGLTPEFLDEADMFVSIPMFGFTESFNISVSVALVLYELTRRLRESGIEWRLSDEEKLEIRLSWLRKLLARHKGLEQRFFAERGA
ncbi:MAG: tRNA (guanosine(18)-2'-O)-methyltransferase [Calditrichaeota bacterium]|nr:tRNA (guanosine(18)-2'-O)-methyltransferase [Calditrichota bacterium]